MPHVLKAEYNELIITSHTIQNYYDCYFKNYYFEVTFSHEPDGVQLPHYAYVKRFHRSVCTISRDSLNFGLHGNYAKLVIGQQGSCDSLNLKRL